MPKSQKKHNPSFKLKVVMETLKEEKTIAQISSEYGVHAVQISRWRKKFKESGPSIFSQGKDSEKENLKELVDELYRQIGQLKVERDWLKKKSEIIN